jgi:hypothetical protein
MPLSNRSFWKETIDLPERTPQKTALQPLPSAARIETVLD